MDSRATAISLGNRESARRSRTSGPRTVARTMTAWYSGPGIVAPCAPVPPRCDTVSAYIILLCIPAVAEAMKTSGDNSKEIRRLVTLHSACQLCDLLAHTLLSDSPWPPSGYLFAPSILHHSIHSAVPLRRLTSPVSLVHENLPP